MSHYFTTPETPERRRNVRCRIWGDDLTFVTADGVFAATGLDKATDVLLRECEPSPNATRVLDLGCGWGVLACVLARALPTAQVDAIDVNERALELTRDNARALGVDARVHVGLPDSIDAAVRYDEIWSNPPIRVGKAALHELLLTWLPRLKPDGVARLVVGKNLGADSLQTWLIEQGWQCERVGSSKGFRVFRVVRG